MPLQVLGGVLKSDAKGGGGSGSHMLLGCLCLLANTVSMVRELGLVSDWIQQRVYVLTQIDVAAASKCASSLRTALAHRYSGLNINPGAGDVLHSRKAGERPYRRLVINTVLYLVEWSCCYDPLRFRQCRAVFHPIAMQLVTKYNPVCIAAWAYIVAASLMGATAVLSVPRNEWTVPAPMFGPLLYWVRTCSRSPDALHGSCPTCPHLYHHTTQVCADTGMHRKSADTGGQHIGVLPSDMGMLAAARITSGSLPVPAAVLW